jgi:hypothetical protein
VKALAQNAAFALARGTQIVRRFYEWRDVTDEATSETKGNRNPCPLADVNASRV